MVGKCQRKCQLYLHTLRKFLDALILVQVEFFQVSEILAAIPVIIETADHLCNAPELFIQIVIKAAQHYADPLLYIYLMFIQIHTKDTDRTAVRLGKI